MEMQSEVLWSVGSQKTDINGCQVSDLEDFAFHQEDSDWNIDAAFIPRYDTPNSPTLFDSLEMGGIVENPVLHYDQEDKEKSPPTTPVSERPNRPVPCLEFEHLKRELNMFLIIFTEICFKKFYYVCILI